jgi:hypothetical protein
LKKRFPKMVYSENKLKKIIIVKSFEWIIFLIYKGEDNNNFLYKAFWFMF